MNELYGAKNILKQRHSGFKSTIHALAEVVDNSIDAGAKNIKVVLSEEKLKTGNSSRTRLTEIFVVDDGCGMDEGKLNRCLTFADGDGGGDGKIGTFGYGLPNSTIFVCKRGDVYSRVENEKWGHVYLDIDEIIASNSSKYPPSKKLSSIPELPFVSNSTKKGTVIRWSNLDNCDAALARTIADRANELLGRLYRYFIAEDKIKIELICLQKGNKTPDSRTFVVPNDPLFLSESETVITKVLWAEAARTGELINPKANSKDPYFDASWHYKKFTEGYEPFKTQKALFRKHDPFWNLKCEVDLGDRTAHYTIKAAYANASIANPGRRSGGATNVGMAINKKMTGTPQFGSANIFWIREGRELDFGSYGIYRTQEQKNRFWTIEIHFDSDLDDLLGVSNTKQSVDFRSINYALDPIDARTKYKKTEQRELLFWDITDKANACYKSMRKILDGYAKEHLRKMEVIKPERKPIPEVEGTVFRAFPKGGSEWKKEEIEIAVKFLKTKYMTIDLKEIKQQVELAAAGLTDTVVLYAPNETGNLFDIEPVRGKSITVFNTNHPYYTKVIQPLKGSTTFSTFTVAIEMLISAFALKKVHVLKEYPDYEESLDHYIETASTQLKQFINRGKVEVDLSDIKTPIDED